MFAQRRDMSKQPECSGKRVTNCAESRPEASGGRCGRKKIFVLERSGVHPVAAVASGVVVVAAVLRAVTDAQRVRNLITATMKDED